MHVVVTIDGLTITLLLAAILYIYCIILVKRKIWSWENNDLGTKKLLVLSVGLVCIVRVMTFIGIAVMDLANIHAHYSPNPHNDQDSDEDDVNQAFYDGAMTVLFDLPNCIVVSTYVLLTLVWAECFLYSRLHTESTLKWRTRWMEYYMTFNVLLYGTQIVLYVLIFWPGTYSTNKGMRTFVYVFMTGTNLIAVTLAYISYVYLGVRFAGFPFRSSRAKQSLHEITFLMTIWSIARVLWGVAMLCIYIFHVELFRPNLAFLLVFLLFIICEIFPILAMLDYSYYTMFHFKDTITLEETLTETEYPIYLSPTTEDLLPPLNNEDERTFVARATHMIFGDSSSSTSSPDSFHSISEHSSDMDTYYLFHDTKENE